jgi:hypothetical protein
MALVAVWRRLVKMAESSSQTTTHNNPAVV